jgi:iron complex outermembrane receptor protein
LKLKQLSRSLYLVGLGMSVAAAAAAQTDPATAAPAPAKRLERVEVTGSTIKRIKDEGALPLQVITAAEMTRLGISSVEQMIANLNINGNGMDNLASNADIVGGTARGNNGATSANLRGQGADSTLVLLNGRRVATHGLKGSAVDLNSIPFAAIERVEILKDGASAIYGTDAIGGVMNFILKKDFKGVQASGAIDATQAGGGNIYRASLVGGAGNLDSDGFNLMASLAFSENKVLRGSDRDFVNTFQPERGLSPDTRGTPYATLVTAGLATGQTAAQRVQTLLNSKGSSLAPIQPGTTQRMGSINPLDLPGGAGCASMANSGPYDELLWNAPSSKWACAWDYPAAAVIQQPVKNTNLVSRGTLKLGEHIAFAELVASRVEVSKSFAPNQVSTGYGTTSYYYPSTGSAYKGVVDAIAAVFPTVEANRGAPLAYRWRCMECGNREIDTTTDAGRLLIGADGPIGNWDYKVGLSQAFSESESKLGGGFFYQTDFLNALGTGIINPFLKPGETQSQAAMDLINSTSARGVTLYGGRTTLTQADASVSGKLYTLPAGDLMMAAGIDLRREEYKFNGDKRAAAARPTIKDAPFDDGNALDNVSRDIKAVFAEVLIPVHKTFELSIAGRQDHYSGFGNTFNPKYTARFTPLDTVLFRGSYNTGFKAPSFNQLFNGVSAQIYTGKDLVDPGKCPTLKVDATKPGCEGITPNQLFGGKEDLQPETAKQKSLGMVLTPIKNLFLNIDWWEVRKQNTIQTFSLPTLQNNYALFTANYLRDASGTLVAIDNRWTNAGESVTAGYEVGARYSFNALESSWLLGLDGSYLAEKKARIKANDPFGASQIGVHNQGGDLGLRWKHTAFLTFSKNEWSATLSQLYRKGYKDEQPVGLADGVITPSQWNPDVAAYITYGVSATYTGFKSLSLTAGVKNLLDKDPPFTAHQNDFSAGGAWEPRVADPRGRSFTLIATYTFF